MPPLNQLIYFCKSSALNKSVSIRSMTISHTGFSGDPGCLVYVSIYSLYYTSDSQSLVYKLKNLLHHNGSFVVIGPASANALDLDNFHIQI